MEALQAGLVQEFEGGFPGHSANVEEAVESLRKEAQTEGGWRVVETRGVSSQHSNTSQPHILGRAARDAGYIPQVHPRLSPVCSGTGTLS